MIPEKLVEISEYLNTQKFEVEDSQRDGRINSILHEDKLTELLAEKYPIDVPEARAWYDFAITDDSIFYPVNIKSTEIKGDCNLQCKLGTYYALTGKIPEFSNECSWMDYFSNLKNDLPAKTAKIDEDYYFMVLDKTETRRTRFAKTRIYALKGLYNITDNGANGFQCNFLKNDEVSQPKLVERSYEEVQKFLLGHLAQCARLSSFQYVGFTTNFPGILKNV